MTFTSFGSFSRPDIGLLSDSSTNLAEIFDSDKRDALRNILIQPEILDRIYRFSEDIDREDLRAASGLSRLLLPSLNKLDEILLDRIPSSLYIRKDFYSFDTVLGGIGSPSLNTPNVILFNGSLQCDGIQYRSNTIGDKLFTSPNRVNVSLSSSRASLFNSESDPENIGYLLNARYSGSIRVRRRSHVNRIIIPKTSFVTKPPTVEPPTHTIQVNVDNGNTGTSTQVKLLATKNSPLRIFCRMSVGEIKFLFSEEASKCFYGYQIQPAQQRPNSPPVEFLPVANVSAPSNSRQFTLKIDISTTGYQNLYDLYLYLYVNPEKVESLEFSGIDIREFPDRKDLGLVGFNNLRTLRIIGGSITILPLWLKTMTPRLGYSGLTTLDLSRSGDTWRTGPMGWFDKRDPSATPSFSQPLYTVVSYLTIPKSGAMINEEGNGWSDVLFQKYILNQSGRIPGTDYRVFSGITDISLGDRFYGQSPRFDDVFPNLRNLSWSRLGRDNNNRTYTFLSGSLPKIAKVSSSMTYNIEASGAQGNILDIGTSNDPSNANHISKYPMRVFNIAGQWGTRHVITGYIGNPSEDWSNWRSNATSINYRWTGTTGNVVKIDLQSDEWTDLSNLSADHSGGVELNESSTPLRTPKLKNLSIYNTTTTGKMFSLGAPSNTSSLETINIGQCNSLSPVTDNLVNYLLPNNFAPPRPEGNEHKLLRFNVTEFSPSYRFRALDLINLHNLTRINTFRSNLTGVFPIFPPKKIETDTKDIEIFCESCNFTNLRNLSVNEVNSLFSRDVITMTLQNQNINGGGCLLPSFEGMSTSRIKVVDMSSSNPSTYSSNWSVELLRGACIRDTDTHTEISGLSITRRSQSDPRDNVYILTGVNNFSQRVLVGDEVRTSLTTPSSVRVASVLNSSVELDSDIPGSLPTTLYFIRKTNSISEWFSSGFTSLEEFRAPNCKLSGTLNIRSGFNNIKDSSRPALDLSRNIISGYVRGNLLSASGNIGLTRIFSGNSRKITINLSQNNLSPGIIREIIDEVSDLDRLRRFNNCRVDLSFNKLLLNGVYSNYTQGEIFPVTLNSPIDVNTFLTRNETFQIYSTTIVTDEDGNETEQAENLGTITIDVPGQLVSGTYYKVRVDKVQTSQENETAIKFKNLRGILITLGFTYNTPPTNPSVISSTYEQVVTRNGSITETGLQPLASCPPGVTGTCWRDTSGRVLRLN